MASTFNKPHGLKYTDMAIYIDEHLNEVTEINANPEVEMKIYEYLYHLFYALAYKAGYFSDMRYYDDYSLYCAGQMYMMLHRKMTNTGQTMHGKEIKPVKSVLNYVKSVLYPWKINFQRQYFHTVLNPEEGHDTQILLDDIKNSIQSQYSLPTESCWEAAVEALPSLIATVMYESPIMRDQLLCKRIRTSVMLTLLDQMTLPNNLQRRWEEANKEGNEATKVLTNKVMTVYDANKENVILWHLDEKYSNYVKILTTRVKKEFSKELSYFIHENDLSDEMLDDIMKTAYTTYDNDNAERTE